MGKWAIAGTKGIEGIKDNGSRWHTDWDIFVDAAVGEIGKGGAGVCSCWEQGEHWRGGEGVSNRGSEPGETVVDGGQNKIEPGVREMRFEIVYRIAHF